MAKRKKRNRTRKEKAARRSASGSDYWLERAARFLRQGRSDEADDALSKARLEPDARMAWLLEHRPERIDFDDPLTPDQQAAVRRIALQLPTVEALAQRLPADWGAQLTTLHAAHHALCDGRIAAFTAGIRALGRKSLFPNAIKALRALSAWYDQDDAAALRLANALHDCPIYQHLAAAIRAGVEPETPTPAVLQINTDSAIEAMFAAVRSKHHSRQLAAYRRARRATPALESQLRVLVEIDPGGGGSQLQFADPKLNCRATMAFPDAFLEGLVHEHIFQVPEIVERIVRRHRAAWPELPTPLITARILRRFATPTVQTADDVRPRWVRNISASLRQDLEDIDAIALDLLAQLRRADGDDPMGWTLAIDLLRRRKRTSEARQLIEAYVTAHPKQPAALQHAAQAAADRGAWDTARRYTHRWAEAQPLDPALADFEALILRGKAIKKAKARRFDVTETLFSEALAIRGLSQNARLQTHATRYLTLQMAKSRDADACRAAALAEIDQPWVFAAWTRLINIGRTTRPPMPWPDQAPTAVEWRRLLTIDTDDALAVLFWVRAINAGTDGLTALDDFHAVADHLNQWRSDLADPLRDPARLALAQAGRALYPDDPRLVLLFGETALRLNVASSALRGLKTSIAKAIKVVEVDDSLRAWALFDRLRRLKALKSDLAARSKKRRRPRQSKAAPSKAARSKAAPSKTARSKPAQTPASPTDQLDLDL